MRSLLLLAALLAVPVSGRAAEAPESDDLTSFGLEALMQLEITSVSRHEEPLFRAASAISVLTTEDIARSGASSIPELLRGVPGMNVAQINGNTWAVSARGFNGQFANKMLVLIDGRTVYTPVFSGVYWDMIDVLLQDVQRIEIIRGPGATAWGANAVNGVINIITRPASSAPGLIATASDGSQANATGALRYAGPAGPTADFRVFAKHRNSGRQEGLDGVEGHEALSLSHMGGRFDWRHGARDMIAFQGDYYSGIYENRVQMATLNPPYSLIADSHNRNRGGNLMASWQRTFSAESDLRLKGYFDGMHRSGYENLRTFDVDFQHRLAVTHRHDFMWGGGYRIVEIETARTPTIRLEPTRQTARLGNLFLQDAIAVVPEHVTLTVGSKFEHNDFSGYEVEPSASVLWSASPTQTVWGAVSRAVRTPGPVDEDLRYVVSVIPLGGGAVGEARLIGTDMRSEIMTSVELGYRTQFHTRVSVDIAGFHSRYLHLRSIEPAASFFDPEPAPGHLVFPQYFANGFHATTRGLESSVEWRPATRFHLTVSHSLYEIRMERNAESSANPPSDVGESPAYQLMFRPHLVVAPNLTLDATWYHVDDLPEQSAPAYDRLDARLGWMPFAGLELSAGVRNVFHDRDIEFANTSGFSFPTTARTGGYGKVTWKP